MTDDAAAGVVVVEEGYTGRGETDVGGARRGGGGRVRGVTGGNLEWAGC